MKSTLEQSARIAEIEQKHGLLRRMPEDSNLADQLLSRCISGTQLFACSDCRMMFAIEPDGETEIWALIPPGS